MLGERVGNFEITASLGSGGMGDVWLAEQQNVKTKVAIKFLHAAISKDTTHVQRFFNEAVAVGKIRHAGIVKIFDVGFHDEQAYLVMEFLEGESLASRIKRRGVLSLGDVANIGRQIASVLEATQEAGVTHRDLKPDNILLVPDSELSSHERVKVLDFGIAKLGDSVGITSTSINAMGTPLYMSPEQWKNPSKADARSDAYSLGCVLFEMACGRPPFLANTVGEACAKHLNQSPPIPSSIVSGLPVAFDDLVLRLLKKKPTSRPTIKEVTETLNIVDATKAVSDPSIPAPPAPPASRATPMPVVDAVAATVETGVGRVQPPQRSSRAPMLLLIVGGLVLAAGAIVIAIGASQSEEAAWPVAPATTPTPPDADVVAVTQTDYPLVSYASLVRTRGVSPQPKRSVPATICIDEEGKLISVQLAEDVETDVVLEVRSKLEQWLFAPYKRNGKPTRVCTVVVLGPKVRGGPLLPRPPTEVVAEPVIDAGVIDAAEPAAPGSAASTQPVAPDAAAIRIGLAPLRASLQECFDRYGTAGVTKVRFHVAPAGHVTSATSDATSRLLADCVVRIVSSARFAASQEGTWINYPITIR